MELSAVNLMAVSSEKSKANSLSVGCTLEVSFISSLTQVQLSLAVIRKGKRKTDGRRVAVIKEAVSPV